MNTNEHIAILVKARQLMEKLVDKPLPEALAQVDGLSQGDKKLASALETLLKAAHSNDTLFTQASNIIFDCALVEPVDLSGQKLGNYELLELIGQGGQSQVYRARRIDQKIQKDVAIKVLFPGHLSKSVLDMFNQEQLTLSRLDHPAIISLHHGGTTAEGVPYLVLDYIDNAQTIQEYIASHRLSPRETVILMLAVIDGLSYAHQHFVVHGDLKPNNILVDRHGHPLLVDFGIARLGKQEGSDIKKALAMTPGYAAPEQVLGQPISTRSDVFSSCAVLLALLSGKPPLPSQNTGDYDALLVESHIGQLLEELRLDNDLKAILRKGLAIVPEQRYDSVAAAGNDLRAWLDGKPVQARSHSRWYRWIKFFSVHKFGLGAVSAILLAIGTGMFFTLQEKERAQYEANKAHQVKNLLLQAIKKSDPEYSLGETISVGELLNEAALALKNQKIEDASLKGELLLTIGSAQAKAGQPQQARENLTQAVPLLPDPLPAQLLLAKVNLENNFYPEARKWLQQAENRITDASQQRQADFQRLKGALLQKDGDFEGAEKLFLTAAHGLNDWRGNIDEWLKNQRALARFYQETGQVESGKSLLKQALGILEDNHLENSPQYINTLYDLALLLQSNTQDDLLDSEKILQQVVEIQQHWYGNKHPKLAKSLIQLATTQRVLGKLQEAQQNAADAFDIAAEYFGKNHVAAGRAEMVLAAIAMQSGNADQALEKMGHAISTFEKHFGNNHFETNQHKTTYAALLLRQGKPQKALEILKPLAVSQFTQLGPKHQAYLYVQLNLIKAYTQLEQLDKAIALGKTSLELCRKNLTPDHLVTIGTQKALADAYYTNGNVARALPLYRELLELPVVMSNAALQKFIQARVVEPEPKPSDLKRDDTNL